MKSFYDLPYEEPQVGDIVGFLHGLGIEMGIVKEVGKRKCLVAGIWGERLVNKIHLRKITDEKRKALVMRQLKEWGVI